MVYGVAYSYSESISALGKKVEMMGTPDATDRAARCSSWRCEKKGDLGVPVADEQLMQYNL